MFTQEAEGLKGGWRAAVAGEIAGAVAKIADQRSLGNRAQTRRCARPRGN